MRNPFNYILIFVFLFVAFGFYVSTIYGDLDYTNYPDNHLCIQECWENIG